MDRVHKLFDKYAAIRGVVVSRQSVTIRVIDLNGFIDILDGHSINVKQVRDNGITDCSFGVACIPEDEEYGPDGGRIVFDHKSTDSVFRNLLSE